VFNKLRYGLGIRRVYDLWQLSHSMKQRGQAQGAPRSRLPDPGRVKANTDAAFQVNGNNGATTCIIRDHQGAFRAAQARWYERVLMSAPWRLEIV